MNYYDYLLNVNKYVCTDSKVRTKNMDVFVLIGSAIDLARRSDDYNVLLNNAMRVAALIKLYQPFQDGNHRTALIVFGNIISEKGYVFNFDKALDDMDNHKLNIPTIYDKDDKMPFPDNWNQYISGKVKNRSV